MNYIIKLILLASVFMTLQADELSTIRVASFPTYKSAVEGIKKFETSVLYKKLLEIKGRSIFKFLVLKKGKYYVIQLEPFQDLQIALEAVNIIHIMYKDAYINRVKLEQIVRQSAKVEIVEKVIIKEKPIIVIKEKNITKQVLQNDIIKKEIKSESKYQCEENNVSLWKTLFWITIILLIVTLQRLYIYRRNNKILVDENRELLDKYNDPFKDIDFDDIDIDLDSLDLEIDFSK